MVRIRWIMKQNYWKIFREHRFGINVGKIEIQLFFIKNWTNGMDEWREKRKIKYFQKKFMLAILPYGNGLFIE